MNAIGESVSAYPLTWPAAWPRTARPIRDHFSPTLTVAKARDEVLAEMRRLGASGVVVSSNAAINRDGRLSGQQRRIDDEGVAVWFTLDGDPVCIPIDRFRRLAANLHAVALIVNSLRGLDRWGYRQMVKAAFSGFAALPAGSGAAGWHEVLKVAPDASRAEIDAAYRALVKVHHPDAGGDAERFRKITEAFEAGRRARG